ncbi:type II toxin-antitoxin system Phd/YefM family antitoxin [Eggerthella sinensis]|uniref:type II toxin-antitoxin system Phd/YefM family antitoxin n=1 Tax=Eggerthella sinensis TaxID=242230 RepID=UPI00266C38B1|nr:type II toxin-antitoxin system Phd/YefM family antitoxin [Eggerthella sinensis]
MPHIIPSTDLRNRFPEVEELAKKSGEPIYLTKNGRGSLVLMDIDAFEEYQLDKVWHRYVGDALAEAELHERTGASSYRDMELAFEELLDEPLEDEGSKREQDAHRETA